MRSHGRLYAAMTELKALTDQDAIDLLNTLGQLSVKAPQQNKEDPSSQPCLSTLPIELIAEITGYLDLASCFSLKLFRNCRRSTVP